VSVRATLAAAFASLAALAVASSLMLVVLTSRMHENAIELRGAARAVELAEGAHLALVTLDSLALERRDRGPPDLAEAMAAREAELRERLRALRGHVASPDAARALAYAIEGVEKYLRASAVRAPPRASATHAVFEAARVQLEELVRLEIQAANEATAAAARWDRTAGALGAATAALAVAAIAALFAWIGARVLRPMSGIARAIAAYGRGDRAVRVEEAGPPDLRAFAATFNEMADALDRQRELQLAFVAAVAHDLRNPLTALKMALARVRPDRPLPPEERLRQTVDVFGRQVARLERLLEDFLDASRIEAGRISLEHADADLRDLAREAVELFGDASPRHRLELVAPAPVPVRCDPSRVAQVLNNLLSNAIKYSPAGGRVAVEVTLEEGAGVVAVSDEGIGVPSAERDRIFEPFLRGAAARDMPGAGIGLSISRRIAEAHGGSLEVESRPDQGSTFRLRLPAGAPPGAAVPEGARRVTQGA
jgi:signal transduction histidine kinase